MTQSSLFAMLLVTACMGINGVRELVARRNISLGILMVAIPLCGWLSIWFGKP
jgi:hypothetical protein